MEELVSRLAALDTPTVSDALDKLGLKGAVLGVGPMTVVRRVVGPVVTVKLGDPQPGLPKRHLGAGAIMAAHRGDVIVVEHGGRLDASGWGGLLSRGALAKEVAGVLIDGAFRDIDEARELGLPIFARGAVPVTARGRVAEHDFNGSITFAGVPVDPGDYVIADGSGAVFVQRAAAREVIRAAEDIFRREQAMAASIDGGAPIGEVLDARYEDMLTQK